MRIDQIKPNVIVRGSLFPEPVQVIVSIPDVAFEFPLSGRLTSEMGRVSGSLRNRRQRHFKFRLRTREVREQVPRSKEEALPAPSPTAGIQLLQSQFVRS